MCLCFASSFFTVDTRVCYCKGSTPEEQERVFVVLPRRQLVATPWTLVGHVLPIISTRGLCHNLTLSFESLFIPFLFIRLCLLARPTKARRRPAVLPKSLSDRKRERRREREIKGVERQIGGKERDEGLSTHGMNLSIQGAYYPV